MTAFAGCVGEGGSAGDVERLANALDMPGARRARVIAGDRVRFVHRQTVTAPQDAAECQPLAGGGGRFLLMLDGFLDNRDELAEALGLGAEASAMPDGAYAMAAVERWGGRAAARLGGPFALALWDRTEGRLLLAVDPLGRRPLYYHRQEGRLAFATNLRALLALPGVPHDLDDQRLADHLLDQPGDHDRSFYAAIRRVPAACTAVFRDPARGGAPVVERYWQPDFERRLHLPRDDDYVEAARELLDRAVRAHLRIAGPVVATVTGGLDSSGVAATAARLLAPGTLTTLTAVPADGVPLPVRRGAYTDDRPYVEAIAARHPNIRPQFCPGSGQHAWDERPEAVFLATGLPWRNIMNLGWSGRCSTRPALWAPAFCSSAIPAT